MNILQFFYLILRFKNWIISILIFTLSYFMAMFISYWWSVLLLYKDQAFLDLVAKIYSHTLFIYFTIIVFSIILTCLARILGFFQRQKIDKMIEVIIRNTNQKNNVLSKKNESLLSILELAPAGILMVEKDCVEFCNENMSDLLCISPDKALKKSISEIFYASDVMLKLFEKGQTALEKKISWSSTVQLPKSDGEKTLYQILALSLDKNCKNSAWIFQDFSVEAWNIELEKYYQTVFRVLNLLHRFKDTDKERDLLHGTLNEIIGIYGLKTAYYLMPKGRYLEMSFSVGNDFDFPNVVKKIDFQDKKNQNIAVVQAFHAKRAIGFSDIRRISYYKDAFRRANKWNVLSTYAFPVIIEGKVEGIISLYATKIDFFSSSLIFRLQQLFSEICENIAIIRTRRLSQQALQQYEKRLRAQIHELEENKKTMQQQAVTLEEARSAAENANKVKSEFIASMSHELRTPLNAILGFSEAMVSETFGPLPPHYKEYTQYVYSSGQYLLSLINDILDLSSIEGGHPKLHETDIDLSTLLPSVMEVAKHYPGGENRIITFRIMPQSLGIHMDERFLKQILLNVISNAIKFTEANGKIDIRIGLTKLGNLKMTIKDNGIGIPKDKIKELFQPFSQIENVMTRKHKGTGLGLVLIKKLAELQQGNVQLKSEEGKGTSVILTFPKERILL